VQYASKKSLVKGKIFYFLLRVFKRNGVLPLSLSHFFTMMDQERIWVLLSKDLAGEATVEEQEELEWAVTANPEWRKTMETLRALRRVPPKGVSSDEEQDLLKKGLERFVRLGETGIWEKKSPGLRISSYRWMAAASVLILLISAAVLYLRNSREAAMGPVAAVPRTIAARRGVRTYMQLPDGSKLWLNAGSKVVYADGFSGGRRELTLVGEAFFDVQHDVAHPFIIRAGKLEVRVLGTSLNVKAYPGDSTIETTLIKGRAEIGFTGEPGSKIVLKPSEKVIITRNPVTFNPGAGSVAHDTLSVAGKPVAFIRSGIVPDKVDGTIAETSWVDNKLIFRNESLAGLAGRLERWYDIKICFDDDRYQQDNVTGAFRDARIEDVMQALKITTGLHYRIAADTVRIW
jgi:ferric-dicitrate binding protein FerR (iron transport regulator)